MEVSEYLRKLGEKGGKAAAASMTKAERKARALKGAVASAKVRRRKARAKRAAARKAKG